MTLTALTVTRGSLIALTFGEILLFLYDCVKTLWIFVALTQLPRAASEPRPAGCGRAAIRQSEYNCSRAEASHWPDRLPIHLDSASRVLSSAHNTLHYAAYI